MIYEEMLAQVMIGKVAFRPSQEGMEVFRQGDAIIRKTYRKNQVNQYFIASIDEINATDWMVRTDEEDADMLNIFCHLQEPPETRCVPSLSLY